MKRDYSRFMPPATPGGDAAVAPTLLDALGWQAHFAQQTSVDELTSSPPVRVVDVHRNGLHVVGAETDTLIPPRADATVGDWFLLDPDRPGSSRLLLRRSLFARRAPGTDRRLQLIAANVDTAFIVSSCNQDFNVARLERYVALAFEAEVEPVILLTKPDLAEHPEDYAAAARDVSARVPVILIDALKGDARQALAEWCRTGRTLAFLGSSGVGKSTLVNALSGTASVETAGIREDDSKGRHTTTRRQLHIVPGGVMVLDTPGMRELQLADAQAGITDLFDDLAELAAGCRFADCQHETEPGCAVLAAIEAGEADPARLSRWRKLMREDRHNSSTIAERRSQERSFGKMVRSVQRQKQETRRQRGPD